MYQVIGPVEKKLINHFTASPRLALLHAAVFPPANWPGFSKNGFFVQCFCVIGRQSPPFPEFGRHVGSLRRLHVEVEDAGLGIRPHGRILGVGQRT